MTIDFYADARVTSGTSRIRMAIQSSA